MSKNWWGQFFLKATSTRVSTDRGELRTTTQPEGNEKDRQRLDPD